METYLLETGKFRLFFSFFFRFKYQKDIEKLIQCFKEWESFQRKLSLNLRGTDVCLLEGVPAYYVYLDLGWKFDRFNKTMRVCMYTRLIHMVSNNNFVRERYLDKPVNLKAHV